MKNLHIALGITLVGFLSTACGTTNAVRWTYGMTSTFDEPDQHSEESGLRVAVGIPVIAGGVAFDAVTWPVQLVFGVWPWWGSSSQHMKPADV